MRGAYRSALWRLGTAIADAYDLALPPGVSGEFSILLIIYRADNGAELGRIDGGKVVASR